MNIEPPTLVRVLDRMERDGLVSRTGCADDRRRKMIKPLPKAKPIWKKIVASAEAVRGAGGRGADEAGSWRRSRNCSARCARTCSAEVAVQR